MPVADGRLRAPGGGAAVGRGSARAGRDRARGGRGVRGAVPVGGRGGRDRAGAARSSARPTRRSRRGSRASWSSAACTTRAAPRASRLCWSASPRASPAGSAGEALGVARGMAMVLAGRRAEEAARPLEEALAAADARAENWDTRAALLWSLIAAERFETVSAAARPDGGRGAAVGERARPRRASTAPSACSTCGWARLPEADAAARVALRVLQEGDFAPGLAFAATVLADVAVEAGELDEAEELLALLPAAGLAGRGRHRPDPGRPRTAAARAGSAGGALSRDFETCGAMFSRELWGIELRDAGYLHARDGSGAGAAAARRARAGQGARAGRAGRRAARSRRRVRSACPCARPGSSRAATAASSCSASRWTSSASSPALLERAHSLAELGAALRRSGRRAAAREPLAEALDLAARCGARPLIAARARGAQRHRCPPAPRVAHRSRGADAERAARRSPRGRGPVQPRDRARAVRDAEDRGGPPLARVREARRRRPRPALRMPCEEKTRVPTL